MTESMHVDQNTNPVPVMRPVNGSDYEITVTGTAAANATAIVEKVVGLYATEDMFLKFGDDEVVAADDDYDVFLPGGHYREYEMEHDEYVSAIQATTGGVLYINGFR